MSDRDIVSKLDLSGEIIAQDRLLTNWTALFGAKPMPQIQALIVSPDEWDRFNADLANHNARAGNRLSTLKAGIAEWGEVVEGAAGVVRTDSGFVILIRADSPYSLNEDLDHELTHIAAGEV